MAYVCEIDEVWPCGEHDQIYLCDSNETLIEVHGKFHEGERVVWITRRVEGCQPLTSNHQTSAGVLLKPDGLIPETIPLGTDVSTLLHATLLPLTEQEKHDEVLSKKLAAFSDTDDASIYKIVDQGSTWTRYVWDGHALTGGDQKCAEQLQIVENLRYHGITTAEVVIEGYVVWDDFDRYLFYLDNIQSSHPNLHNFVDDIGFCDRCVHSKSPLFKHHRTVQGIYEYLHDIRSRDLHVQGLLVVPHRGDLDPIEVRVAKSTTTTKRRRREGGVVGR